MDIETIDCDPMRNEKKRRLCVMQTMQPNEKQNALQHFTSPKHCEPFLGVDRIKSMHIHVKLPFLHQNVIER